MEVIKLNIAEKIERAKDGRTQVWIIQKMNQILPDDKKLSEAMFSRRKKGFEEFSEQEIKALEAVLPGFKA